MIALKPRDELELDPGRYRLTSAQRRALWHNEISMFIVLVMPLIVATFWYGSTIEVIVNGQVTAAASLGRGVGLTVLVGLFITIASAVWLFIKPAAERVANAQPVRGYRRLSFAAFDGLLVFLITYQSLAAKPDRDDVVAWALSVTLGSVAALFAYVAMHSMVDIPEGTPLELWTARIDER